MNPNLRESLHERHQDAVPRLDALRETIVADLRAVQESAAQPEPPASGRPGLLGLLWIHVFRPMRYGWGALVAAWLVIAALNLANPETEPVAVAQAPRDALDVRIAERRAELARLLNLPDPADRTDPVLRPRGCARQETCAA